MCVILFMIEHYCVMADREVALYDHSDAFDHLKYIGERLKSHGVEYWLMLDTLLGGVREGDILKSLNGVDIGTWLENYKSLLGMNELVKKDGYRFTESFVTGNKYPEGTDKTIWRVSVNVFYFNKNVGDIYFFSRFADKIARRYSEGIDYWPSIFTVPEWFFDKLDSVWIRKIAFPIPRAAGILLDYWYGTKWRNRGGLSHKNTVMNRLHRLSFLTSYVKEGGKLEARSNEAKYTYPIDQIKWIKENDPVHESKLRG
ncbi:MAG: hypothetical protein Harvfovirus62_8 [Harvfovirus sp.]|uniref:Uncharacterized protein n=1 Tax=Harvfovirus sp. TaxID=2487768 RepID=A0A3G5A3I7_9VIRU|nr:MAG: hypothetical protein Harvfovirus62_8 [Harvfovirus sp.]